MIKDYYYFQGVVDDHIGNPEGSLTKHIQLSLVVLFTYFLIVSPWRSAIRKIKAVLYSVALLAFTIYSFVNAMHEGGIAAVFCFWLAATWLCVTCGILINIIQSK